MKNIKESTDHYRKWVSSMPPIPFKPDWVVTLLPPFAGALVRFRAEKNGLTVSVYLDVDGSLGCYTDDDGNEVPYWEVHPYGEDDFRCGMYDVASLVAAIDKSLNERNQGEDAQ